MLPYIILLLVPILMQHIGLKGVEYQKKNQSVLLFYFLFLTVLISLRNKYIGNDTTGYIRMFDRYSMLGWAQLSRAEYEVGYLYLNKLVSLFTDDPQVFLAVAAILVSALIYPTYRRLCIDPSLTIVLFGILPTFAMAFSGIRQMIAIAIGFVAYELTRRKKLLSFLLSVSIAVTFHSSAVMLFAMYPLYHARITRKHLLIVVPVILLIYVYNAPIFTYLLALLERFTRFEGQIIESNAYMMILLFSVFTVYAFVIPDERQMDEETIGLRNFLLFALILQFFAPLHVLAMRMNYYYIIYIPLLLPKIIESRSRRWNQVALFSRHVMVLFFTLYFFMNLTNSNPLNIYPYHFFWENIVL